MLPRPFARSRLTWNAPASAHAASWTDSGEQKRVPGQHVRRVSVPGKFDRVRTHRMVEGGPDHLPVTGESLRIGFVPLRGLSILVCVGEWLSWEPALDHLPTTEPEWILTCVSMVISYGSGQCQPLGDLIPPCEAGPGLVFIPTCQC